MNKMQLADIFKIESFSMEKSWEEEERNVEMILAEFFGGQNHSYDDLMKELAANEKTAVVPETVDYVAKKVMDEIAAQAEKSEKKKDVVYTAVFLVVGLLALVGIFRSRFLKNNEQFTESSDMTVVESTETSEAVEESIIINVELLDENATYYADIEMQNYGTIVIELDQKAAPITAANFVELAESGFYDGLTFHRILKGYMMQGGDPNGDGTGTSGKSIYGEFEANGYKNTISHKRGTISMARPDDFNGASCQFFIMQGDYVLWNGYYAAFGTVLEGMEVVDAICDAGFTADGNGVVKAEEQPVINKITIRKEAKTVTE
jgi:peptidyl-prolyl cis-trans isomerase B (cyclophilin B)